MNKIKNNLCAYITIAFFATMNSPLTFAKDDGSTDAKVLLRSLQAAGKKLDPAIKKADFQLSTESSLDKRIKTYPGLAKELAAGINQADEALADANTFIEGQGLGPNDLLVDAKISLNATTGEAKNKLAAVEKIISNDIELRKTKSKKEQDLSARMQEEKDALREAISQFKDSIARLFPPGTEQKKRSMDALIEPQGLLDKKIEEALKVHAEFEDYKNQYDGDSKLLSGADNGLRAVIKEAEMARAHAFDFILPG
jgi:hypothetical protein